MTPPFDLSVLDTGAITRLMKLLASTDVEECEIEQGQYSIVVRREPIAPSGSGAFEVESLPEQESAADEPSLIRSLAVGIFYRSEKRSGLHDVDAGARVKVGDVLGCIEVMGVPHGVYSTCEGVVGEFLVDDGEPVEYGQPVVAISQ